MFGLGGGRGGLVAGYNSMKLWDFADLFLISKVFFFFLVWALSPPIGESFFQAATKENLQT